MMISRTLSTCVLVAASISSTSMSRPSAISTQASHVAAGIGGRALFAVEAARQDARRRGLADAARAGEHERLGDAPAGDSVAQRLRDRALADHVFESLWPPLPGEDLVRHSGVVESCRVEGRRNASRLSHRRAAADGPHRDPEAPAAHFSDCLALLPSGPDAVRRLRLHRVRIAVRPGGHLAPPRPSRTGRTQAFSVLRSPLVR